MFKNHKEDRFLFIKRKRSSTIGLRPYSKKEPNREIGLLFDSGFAMLAKRHPGHGTCRAVDHRPVVAAVFLRVVVEGDGCTVHCRVAAGEESHVDFAVLVYDRTEVLQRRARREAQRRSRIHHPDGPDALEPLSRCGIDVLYVASSREVRPQWISEVIVCD